MMVGNAVAFLDESGELLMDEPAGDRGVAYQDELADGGYEDDEGIEYEAEYEGEQDEEGGVEGLVYREF